MGRYTEGADTEAIDAVIQDMFGNGYDLEAVEGGSDVWAAVLEIMDYIFTLVGILALGLAGLIMFNTFRTTVVERKQDIGMLRAVGASRRAVMRTILIESLIQAGLGTLLGVVIGVFFAYGFRSLGNSYFQSLMGAPLGRVSFTPVTIILTLLFGLGIPLASTLIPARNASHVSPLEALRPTTIEQEANIRRSRLALGVILLVLSLVGLFTGEFAMMSLGMILFLLALGLLGPLLMTPITSFFSRAFRIFFAQEGELAAGNIARQPRRAAITTTSLMISLAILIGLGGMLSSTYGGALIYLERSLRSDYILLPGALVVTNATIGAGPELADTVRNLPGVSEVATMRQIDIIDEAGNGIRLIGIDPQTYGRVGGLSWVEGNESTFAELRDPAAAIINTRYSITFGVEMGDTLTVPSDGGPVTLQVVGIGLDYLNMKLPSVYMQQDALTREFGVRNDVLLLVNTEEGADRAQLEEDLLALMTSFPGFGVLSREQLMTSQENLASQATVGFNMVLALIAAPALIGLANTMGINVLERTREIGMLRAVGARRKQVRRMIVAESLMLSIMGAAFGVLAGTWLSVVMIGVIDFAGIRLAYSFPLAGVITATAVGLICGVLAALIPARRASDLDIVRALAYE
jgi:putative ABC transport system permease protein